MDMTTATVRFTKAYDEVQDIVKAKAGEQLLDMSAEEFGMVKALLNFADASMELTRAQAETIDNINNKLDMLLEKSK